MADYGSDHRCSVALKFTKSMLFPSVEQAGLEEMNKMHVINTQRAKQVNLQIIVGLIKALYFFISGKTFFHLANYVPVKIVQTHVVHIERRTRDVFKHSIREFCIRFHLCAKCEIKMHELFILQ